MSDITGVKLEISKLIALVVDVVILLMIGKVVTSIDSTTVEVVVLISFITVSVLADIKLIIVFDKTDTLPTASVDEYEIESTIEIKFVKTGEDTTVLVCNMFCKILSGLIEMSFTTSTVVVDIDLIILVLLNSKDTFPITGDVLVKIDADLITVVLDIESIADIEFILFKEP
ncbi:hypothetical protein CHL78_017140 [Romboutsia weinsteinii]|uniref:Uncharacterized protein n=1 Tax=Romboutsia weinsteinii TaxID=2020949 RepID=A0A371IYU8_9FIRM|nr:hypothetical protein CHL78_017140 [Romboutsia weinsteinii]